MRDAGLVGSFNSIDMLDRGC